MRCNLNLPALRNPSLWAWASSSIGAQPWLPLPWNKMNSVICWSFMTFFDLGMPRRERVRNEKVNNIVFLRRVKEGLLERIRSFIECSNLRLESFDINPPHCQFVDLFKWDLWFCIVVVGRWLSTEVCEALWIVGHFNLFLQPGALGGWGGKETLREWRNLGCCVSEK